MTVVGVYSFKCYNFAAYFNEPIWQIWSIVLFTIEETVRVNKARDAQWNMINNSKVENDD